ncbi:uncharacterized protein LOC136094171 [Hydra vulgaris]|uniref:uncharacterized protein LOC136094171 n=1 Tax=Hydra vulgaris TaxID=6087 RepID=UPI0032E9D9C8
MSENELTNILLFYLEAYWQQFANYLNMQRCVIDAIDNDYNRSYLKKCRVITLFFQVNPEEKFNPHFILKTLQKWLIDELQKNNFKLTNNLNELIFKVKNRIIEPILTKIKMEAIYDDVNKAIYKYGKPVVNKVEPCVPYEAIFVDGNSILNLKNIDVLDEKEDYEMADDEYNDDEHDDDECNDDDDEYNDEYDENDDEYYDVVDKEINNIDENEPMEIDN